MDKINIDNENFNLGTTKFIIGPDDEGYIFKSFKKDGIHEPYSFERQSNIIEKKKQYIGKFIPETELIKDGDAYYIKQKYIEGKLIKYIDVEQLDEKVLSDLLELFDGYVAFCRNEGIEIDIIGYQPDIHHLENMRKRRYLYYTRIFDSFLESTNIMISNDNKVYMVDVCDTVPVKGSGTILYKIKYALRQAISELGIKNTKYKIHRIINRKRKELYNALY